MAKLLHIFYHKEGTFSLLCQQVQLITVSFTDFSIVKATAPHSLFATIFFTDHFTRLLLSHSSPLTVSSDIHSAVPHTAP